MARERLATLSKLKFLGYILFSEITYESKTISNFFYSPKNELYLQKSHNNTSLKIFHNMITEVFVMPLKDPPCTQS